jgi:hypothetical protein
MTREVRIVLWILTVLLLAALVTPALGFYPPVLLLIIGPWLVLPVMAWGMLDAAYHRDSVWREADQNKVVWVLVQFIPLVGTMAYYILVHPTVLEAETGCGAGRRPARRATRAPGAPNAPARLWLGRRSRWASAA